jgi:hypothetical protein
MGAVVIFVLVAAFAGLAFWLWVGYRRWSQSQRMSEERFANVMVQAMTSAKAAPGNDEVGLAQQKLLFEAAAKAGEAGEAVLSIQLYARLVARFPNSAFGAQARAAVEAQKKKLVIAKAPGKAAPG